MKQKKQHESKTLHEIELIRDCRKIKKSSWKIQYFVKEGRIILRKQDPKKCPLEVGDRIRVHVNMLTHNVVTIIQDKCVGFEVEHRYPGSHEVEFFEKYKCELYDAAKDPFADQHIETV